MLTKTLKLYKDSYSDHSKEVWVLAALTLINRIGTMVLPFLAVYLTTVLKFPLKQSGTLVGAFGFGSLVGTFLGGRLSDRIGPNRVIILSLSLSGVMLISLQFALNFYSLFVLIFITAAFGEAYRPAISTCIGNYVHPSKIGRTMALLRLAINLGMGASPAIGGFIITALSYNWLFWIDGITCIAAASYFFIASNNWIERKALKQNEKVKVERDNVIPPHKNTIYLLFLLTTFMMAFGFLQWIHIVPVFIKNEWGFDERYIGLLMATNAIIITTIEMPLIHIIENRRKVKSSIYIGLVLIGLSFLPFLFPKMLVICFISMTILTIGEILTFPLNNAIALSMAPPSRRGEYMSLYAMSWSLAHILAPILGFTIIDQFGYEILWILIALTAVLGLIISLKISGRINY